MKKLAIVGAISLMLTACAGLMGGGNPQIKALNDTSARIGAKFTMALGYTSEAFVYTLEAVGNKTEAERIKSETANLRSGDGDKDKMEQSIGMLNEVDLNAQLENAGELSDDAKAQLVDGIVNLGIAIYWDALIIPESVDAVKEAKDILQNLSASDALAAGEVKGIIENVSWISDVAPDQLSSMKTTFGNLKAYAEAHGIEVPSQEEIDQKAAGLARQ